MNTLNKSKNLGRLLFSLGVFFLTLSMALNMATGVTYALPALQQDDTPTSGPIETATEAPVDTATSPAIDTATSAPIETATSEPVDTATTIPADTATTAPVDTATTAPVDTATSAPVPTDTDTAVPATNTSLPIPTATVAFTRTATPLPTATPEPEDPFLILSVACLVNERARFTIRNLGGDMVLGGSYTVEEPGIGTVTHQMFLQAGELVPPFETVGNATVTVYYATSTLIWVTLGATGACIRPTSTPIPTVTRTPTITSTFTATQTRTATITPTITATFTTTQTRTITLTPTITATFTRTRTRTITITRTPTRTTTVSLRTRTSTSPPRATNGRTNTPDATDIPTSTPLFTNQPTLTSSPSVIPSGTFIATNTSISTPSTPSLTPTNQSTVQLSGTPTAVVLLAPEIDGPTPTVGTSAKGEAQVLIPVTGADLSEKVSERKLLISRIHQVQWGMNFMGFGLMLIGIMLMRSKKED